jgi:hypothetical protein
MRKSFGFGVVLTAACLGGTSDTAYGQAGGPATVGGRLGTTTSSSLVTAPNNLEQKANEQAQANGTPAAAGQPGNANMAPGMTGNMATQPNVPSTNPGATYTPGLANPGEWNYRSNAPNTNAARAAQGIYPGTATAATPGYTSREMPGMGGYNGVNPMGTTMAPSYYYAGTAGMPYATYNSPGMYGAGGAPSPYGATTAYPNSYITPGYNATQVQGYTYQRRGLFGRRNRVVYPANTYGATTYGTYPGTTYRAYPSGYTTYSTTTYYPNSGSYTYGSYPY